MTAAAVEATTAVEAAAVGLAAEARMAPGGIAMRDAAVIEAAEGAGTGRGCKARLGAVKPAHRMRYGRCVGDRCAMPAGTHVAVPERRAMRDPRVVVPRERVATPVEPPVVPAPADTGEEAHVEAEAPVEARSRVVGARHADPIGISDERGAIHDPRVVSRDVDDARIGRLDRDALAGAHHRLLRCAAQRSCSLRPLPQ